MDVVKTIKDTVEKITKDPALLESFKKDPVKAVESVIGVDLPDDTINQIIDGVKAKITVDNAAGILDQVKKLF